MDRRSSSTMHMLLRSEFARLLREATRLSRQGTEICGLLIDTGRHLRFLQTRNISPRRGGFAFSPREVRRVVAELKTSGHEVVGTFHSHPVGLPAPGPSDIENAVDDFAHVSLRLHREGRTALEDSGWPRASTRLCFRSAPVPTPKL